MMKFNDIPQNLEEVTFRLRTGGQGPRLRGHLFPGGELKIIKSLIARRSSQYMGQMRTGGLKQNSIVKFSYSQNKYLGQWKAHGRYIMRDSARGVEQAFDAIDEGLDVARVLEKWQVEAGVSEALYKIIISPEKAQDLRLKEHIRGVMKQMEHELHQPLEWMAVIHRNTHNPHAHVVLRGRDAEGQTLVIPNEFRKNRIREISRDLATEELGFRTRRDVLERRQKVLCAEHVTEIDRQLAREIRDDAIAIEFKRTDNAFVVAIKFQLVTRLNFLTEKGFMERVGEGYYKVKEDFIEGLKAEQVKHDILKSINHHRKALLNQDAPVRNKILDTGERLIGRVAGAGVADDARDTRYLMVETVDGEACRIIINGKLLKMRDQMRLRNGDIVYLERKEFSQEGKPITYTHVHHTGNIERGLQKLEVNDLDRHYYASRDYYYHQQCQSANPVREYFIDRMEKRLEFIKSNNLFRELIVDNKRREIPPRSLELGRERDS